MKNIYIIGAGLAGLSASVNIFESSNLIGGRCRSFFDKRIGQEIDNGNHLVFSANKNFYELCKIVRSLNSLQILPFDLDFFDKKQSIYWNLNLEKINFTIKKKFYYKDRRVYLNNPFESRDDTGPIASSFLWNPSKEIRFNSYLNYSDEQSKINNLGLGVLYTNENINIGIGQKFRRINSSLQDDLNLTEFFMDLPLENGYSFFALGQRDNETDKFIETRFGLGYENCCFAASLSASKRTLIRFNDINFSNNMFLNQLWDNIIETENKSRINISFQLKGFNNAKRGFKRYIQNSILN